MRPWIMLAASIVVSTANAQPPKDAPTSGALIFDDEFDTLDLSRYTTSYPWGDRWIEEEQEVYVDPSYRGNGDNPLGLNPFSIVDGKLRIEAAIPAATAAHRLPRPYTSGVLTTYNSFVHRYGYFEIRAKVPAGKGYWPAFWLIPKKSSTPHPPEIDVVEVLGDRLHTLFVTAHWQNGHQRQFSVYVPDLSADFHRYGVLWTATNIAWYFDGERVAFMPTPAEHNQPMYLLLDLAVGGKWPGSPTQATKFPGYFLVDYIRVYEGKNDEYEK